MNQKHMIIFNKNLLKLSLFCKYIILNNFFKIKLFSRMYLQKLIYPIEINYTIVANHLWGRPYACPRRQILQLTSFISYWNILNF